MFRQPRSAGPPRRATRRLPAPATTRDACRSNRPKKRSSFGMSALNQSSVFQPLRRLTNGERVPALTFVSKRFTPVPVNKGALPIGSPLARIDDWLLASTSVLGCDDRHWRGAVWPLLAYQQFQEHRHARKLIDEAHHGAGL